jgi:hypothetical protein
MTRSQAPIVCVTNYCSNRKLVVQRDIFYLSSSTQARCCSVGGMFRAIDSSLHCSRRSRLIGLIKEMLLIFQTKHGEQRARGLECIRPKKIPGEPGIFRSLYYARVSLQRLNV